VIELIGVKVDSEPVINKARAFDTLRQLARRQPRNVEHCELCSAAVRSEHAHLIELPQRRVLCACTACALLFGGRSDAKFKLVPRDVRRLVNFQMTDAEWDGLLIPINLAFFVLSGTDSRVSALYPSPAGATESLLPLETWSNIVQTNPVLGQMRPEVEALLVNRVGHARGASQAEYFVAPIDECFRLVGLIRMHWRGLSGGEDVWREIGNFFAALRSRAEIVEEANHA
jgi:Family of unknown function (DUF5947)